MSPATFIWFFCLQKLKFYTIKFNYYFHTSRILPNYRSAPSREKKNPFPVSRTSTTQKDTCLSQCLIHQEITSIKLHTTAQRPQTLCAKAKHTTLSLSLFVSSREPLLSRAQSKWTRFTLSRSRSSRGELRSITRRSLSSVRFRAWLEAYARYFVVPSFRGFFFVIVYKRSCWLTKKNKKIFFWRFAIVLDRTRRRVLFCEREFCGGEKIFLSWKVKVKVNQGGWRGKVLEKNLNCWLEFWENKCPLTSHHRS